MSDLRRIPPDTTIPIKIDSLSDWELSNRKVYQIAHITDTHIGVEKYHTRDGIVYNPRSIERFAQTIDLIQDINPDLVLHTGDVFGGDIFSDRNLQHKIRSKLGDRSGNTQKMFYIMGNHDKSVTKSLLPEILPDWDLSHIGQGDGISVCDDDIILYGRDHTKHIDSVFDDVSPPTVRGDQICIGLFHQSFVSMTPSLDSTVRFDDIADKNHASEYDIILLGHMHNRRHRMAPNVTTFVGGSATGLDCRPTIGVLTLTRLTSKYRHARVGPTDSG